MVAGKGNDQPSRCCRLSPGQLAPRRAAPKREVSPSVTKEKPPGQAGEVGTGYDTLEEQCELLKSENACSCLYGERDNTLRIALRLSWHCSSPMPVSKTTASPTSPLFSWKCHYFPLALLKGHAVGWGRGVQGHPILGPSQGSVVQQLEAAD